METTFISPFASTDPFHSVCRNHRCLPPGNPLNNRLHRATSSKRPLERTFGSRVLYSGTAQGPCASHSRIQGSILIRRLSGAGTPPRFPLSPPLPPPTKHSVSQDLINRLPGELLARVFCHVDDAKTLLIVIPSVSMVLGSIAREELLSRRSGLADLPTHPRTEQQPRIKRGFHIPQFPAVAGVVRVEQTSKLTHRCWHCFPGWC